MAKVQTLSSKTGSVQRGQGDGWRRGGGLQPAYPAAEARDSWSTGACHMCGSLLLTLQYRVLFVVCVCVAEPGQDESVYLLDLGSHGRCSNFALF